MTINCLGKLIDLDQPRVMGILNLTPDSFYDGGRFTGEEEILRQAGKMLEEGATFLDVGGYSSRPGARDISETEELDRLRKPLKALLKTFPDLLVSVDTFRSGVARYCLDEGAAMVNDISGGSLDPAMMATVASYQVPYVAMHMRGRPQDMDQLTEYEDLIGEVLFTFSQKLSRARTAGIRDCLLDPGFGFAKTIDQNFELLANLDQFAILGCPLLVGLSRKSMVYKTLDISAQEALNGSTVLHTIALTRGARILRVHDVKEAMECIRLVEALSRNTGQAASRLDLIS